MRYRTDQLLQLRERLERPLLSSDSGEPMEVDGCRTFRELLQHRFSEIRAHGEMDGSGGDGVGQREGFRRGWQQRATE